MDIAQVLRMMALLSHACLLLCHPTSWRSYQPLFLPGPQFCPDTGRTVCAAVDYYPTDQIYHLLTSARSQIFNLTSLFVDERKGDVEPNLAQLPTQPPHYRDGYGSSQPPPGGRFSPAGYNNWNSPTSDKPPNYSGQQPDRWRQVPQNNGNGHNGQPGIGQNGQPGIGQNGQPGIGQNGQPGIGQNGQLGIGQNGQPGIGQNGQPGVGISRTSYSNGSRRQSRAQNLSNQRLNLNYGRIPIATPKYNNYGVQMKREGNDHFGDYNYGVTQHNRIEPYKMNNGFSRVPFPGNFSGFHPQDIQRQQEPYQIQPPFVQHNVKGQGMYPVMTVRPHINGNWKGSPAYTDYSKTPHSESLHREPIHSRFNRRERRNQDVEVACQVQSTYVPPRAALSDNSEWRYIINVPERDRRFSQVVRVDVCLNEGQPCSSRLSLPFGFESRCRQKYIKKKLLSLNADGQGTSEDNFFIPSCCVCEITRPNKRK